VWSNAGGGVASEDARKFGPALLINANRYFLLTELTRIVIFVLVVITNFEDVDAKELSKPAKVAAFRQTFSGSPCGS
jgi:hypothetical protein